MRDYIDPISQKKLIWPGVDEFAISDEDVIMKTILGTCVGLVIYDKNQRLFGINHFLNVKSGITVCEKLLIAIRKKSSTNLRAYLFGGMESEDTVFQIGRENIAFARSFLHNAKIKLDGEDVGGRNGRTITVTLQKRGDEFFPNCVVTTHGSESHDKEIKALPDAVKEMYEFMLKVSKK